MKPITPNLIWDDLRPRIVALIEERSGVRTVSSATTSSGGMAVHDIGGALHSGTLRNDQATQFLLLDGTRDLLGNLAVSSGVTIDGVDISAHAANPDAHHAQAHVLATATALGPDHTISGATGGHVLRASGATAAAFAQLQHGDLGGVTSDQHHAKLHAMLDTAHHSYSGGANLDVFGLSAASTLAKLTPSYDVSAGTSAILRSNSGALTLAQLTTPLIDAPVTLSIEPVVNLDLAPGNNVLLNPTGDVVLGDTLTFRTNSFSTFYPIEGAILSETDVSGRYAFAVGVIETDELRARVFVADEVRVDRGEEIWGKSYGIVAEEFVTPGSIGGTVTVTFESSPMVAGPLFSSGDWLLFRTIDIDTGMVLSAVWGQVTGYSGSNVQPFWLDTMPDDGVPDSSFPFVDLGTTTQEWTFTLRSGDTNYTIEKGNLGIDYGAAGQSYIAFSVTDPVSAPFIRIRRWTGANPYTPANHDDTVYIGNLNGVADASGDRGIWTQSSDGTAFAELSDQGVVLRNSGISLYSSGVQKVNISATGTDVWIGASSSDKRLSWDGSTLNVVGSITVTAGNAAKVDFSNITATLDAVGDGSTYKRTTTNQRDGGGYGYTGLNSSGYVKLPVRGASISGSPATGLNLTATHMGYYDGAAWKTWIASTGQFYFGGSSGAHLEWDGTYLKGVNSSNGTEWQASSADGMIYAGATVIGAHGVRFDNDLSAGIYDLAWEMGGTSHGYIRGSYDLSDWLGLEIYSAGGVYVTTGGGATTIAINDNNVWHEGNDGSGSGLDADKLDNYHAASFALLSGATFTGNVTLGDTYYLAADKVRARDSGGLRLEEDAGTLGIFIEDSTGAVGVNTTSPTSGVKLDVNGQIYARAASTIDGGVYLKTVSAPSTPPSTYCVIYHDTSDGDLKVKFPNGTTATIATN